MCGMIIVWGWGQEVEAMPVFAEGFIFRTRLFSHKSGMVIDGVEVGVRGGAMVWGSVRVGVWEGVDRTRIACLSTQQPCSPEVQPTIPSFWQLAALYRSLLAPALHALYPTLVHNWPGVRYAISTGRYGRVPPVRHLPDRRRDWHAGPAEEGVWSRKG